MLEFGWGKLDVNLIFIERNKGKDKINLEIAVIASDGGTKQSP